MRAKLSDKAIRRIAQEGEYGGMEYPENFQSEDPQVAPLTRRQIIDMARELILDAVSISFYRLSDMDLPEEQSQLVYAEMDKQMMRIEKFLGYEPGSWGREG